MVIAALCKGESTAWPAVGKVARAGMAEVIGAAIGPKFATTGAGTAVVGTAEPAKPAGRMAGSWVASTTGAVLKRVGRAADGGATPIQTINRYQYISSEGPPVWRGTYERLAKPYISKNFF